MKPFALPKPFQSLSDEQLVDLNEWLDDPALTYKVIREKLFELHGLKISDATLTRYNQRRELAEQTMDHDDSAQNIRAFIALQNAQPVAYDTAGLALIQKRAFDAACAPRITVSNLAALQRIFNYQTARTDIEHRKQISERMAAVHEAKLALAREKQTTGKNSSLMTCARSAQMFNRTGVDSSLRGSDALGPFARNLEEIRERTRKAFGITPEESARRAELRRTWKPPELVDPQPTTTTEETISVQQLAHLPQTDSLPPVPSTHSLNTQPATLNEAADPTQSSNSKLKTKNSKLPEPHSLNLIDLLSDLTPELPNPATGGKPHFSQENVFKTEQIQGSVENATSPTPHSVRVQDMGNAGGSGHG